MERDVKRPMRVFVILESISRSFRKPNEKPDRVQPTKAPNIGQRDREFNLMALTKTVFAGGVYSVCRMHFPLEKPRLRPH